MRNSYFTNSQNDQLPVDLIAQLVEYYTGIVEVMGSNPVQASNLFSGFLLATVHNCGGHSPFHFFVRCSNICILFIPLKNENSKKKLDVVVN